MSKVTNQSNFNSAALGQYGAICVKGTDTVTPPRGMVFCAITALDALTLSKATTIQEAQDQTATSLSTTAGRTNKLQINGTTTGPFVTFNGSTSNISVGDMVYGLSTDNFLGFVKSVGVASDGSANDNVLEVDRLGAYVDTTSVGFRSKDRGYTSGADTLSSAVIPKGVTIYGAWTSLKSSGSDFIAYLAPAEDYAELN